MNFLATKQVSELLDVPPIRLQQAIWNGRMESPEKGPGGAFCWTSEDIDNASQTLLGHPYVIPHKNPQVG